MKNSIIFAFITLLIIPAILASAQSSEVKITDFFSNIDGCDVTIQGQSKVRNLSLNFELLFEGKIIDSKYIEVESIEANKYYTYFISWNSKKEEGAYTARVELRKGNYATVAHFNFTYGRAALPRLHVTDFLADSTGVYLLVRPFEPVMVDAYFHLIDGNRSIYSVEEKNLAIIEPQNLNKNWGIILENNKQYAARVKLHLYKPEMTIACTRWFTARDNAIITDVYADRTGVSATIKGKSQVPLRGTVLFTVMQEGEVIEFIQKPSPSILLNEEKTVEAMWKKQLNAGLYDVRVELLGNDGDILYQYDKVIEVEPIAAKLTPSPTKQASAPAAPLAILAIFIAFFMSLRERYE